jgi:outer membrane receptor protein involved in Fe transport
VSLSGKNKNGRNTVMPARKFLQGTALGLILMPVSAIAQTSGATPPVQTAAATESAETGLAEITVTAQRRGENIQRVPIAVSAISADQLAATGMASTGDIKLAVASADVPILNGYALPFIRGIGTKAVGPATESSVSTYVDNVYIGSAVGALLSFNNITRIEVLKGPQGTLFGRNATGGPISIITRDPGNQLELDARASYGNYETVRGAEPDGFRRQQAYELYNASVDFTFWGSLFDLHLGQEPVEYGSGSVSFGERAGRRPWRAAVELCPAADLWCDDRSETLG